MIKKLGDNPYFTGIPRKGNLVDYNKLHNLNLYDHLYYSTLSRGTALEIFKTKNLKEVLSYGVEAIAGDENDFGISEEVDEIIKTGFEDPNDVYKYYCMLPRVIFKRIKRQVFEYLDDRLVAPEILYLLANIYSIDLKEIVDWDLTKRTMGFFKHQLDLEKIIPEDKKFYEFDINDYRFISPLKVLGTGAYGAVFVVRIYNYGLAVMKLPNYQPTAVKDISKECSISQMVNCISPHLMCFRACLVTNSFSEGKGDNQTSGEMAHHIGLAYFSDYYEGYVSLDEWGICLSWKVFSQIPKVFSRGEIASFLAGVFRKIVLGVMDLHRLHVAHRDIKPENIIIKDDMPILIDYGLAVKESEKTLSLAGSFSYIPRLIFDSHLARVPSDFQTLCKADFYAVGMTLYRILYNRYMRIGDIDSFFKRGAVYLDELFAKPVSSFLGSWPTIDPVIEFLLTELPVKEDEVKDTNKKINKVLEMLVALE